MIRVRRTRVHTSGGYSFDELMPQQIAIEIPASCNDIPGESVRLSFAR